MGTGFLNFQLATGKCCSMKMYKFLSVYIALAAFNSAYGARELTVDGVRTWFALKGDHIVISCDQANRDMGYCSITHPKGERQSFFGSTLENGQCVYALNATKRDEGDWTCHVGKKNSTGEELTEIIRVRVTDVVTAVRPVVYVKPGEEATLSCITAQAEQPIESCIMIPPEDGAPIHLDSSVTREKALLNNYFYPANMSLERGDCGVSIIKPKFLDHGTWTCAVWITGHGEFMGSTVLVIQLIKGQPDWLYMGLTAFSFPLAVLLILYIVVQRYYGSCGNVNEAHEMATISAPTTEQFMSESENSSPTTNQAAQQTGSEPTAEVPSTESPSGSRERSSTVDKPTSSVDQPSTSSSDDPALAASTSMTIFGETKQLTSPRSPAPKSSCPLTKQPMPTVVEVPTPTDVSDVTTPSSSAASEEEDNKAS